MPKIDLTGLPGIEDNRDKIDLTGLPPIDDLPKKDKSLSTLDVIKKKLMTEGTKGIDISNFQKAQPIGVPVGDVSAAIDLLSKAMWTLGTQLPVSLYPQESETRGKETVAERLSRDKHLWEVLGGDEDPKTTAGKVGQFATDLIGLDLLIPGGAAKKGITRVGKATKSLSDDFIRGIEKATKEVGEEIAPKTIAMEKKTLESIEDFGKAYDDILEFEKAASTTAELTIKAEQGIKTLDNIEQLGQSTLRLNPTIENVIKKNPGLIKMKRGEGMPNEMITKIASEEPVETLIEMDKKFNLGNALIERKASLNVGDNIESIIKMGKTGEVDPKLAELFGFRAAWGRGGKGLSVSNRMILEKTQSYLAKVKKDTPGIYKATVKEVEKQLGEVIPKGDLNPSFVKKFVEFATMVKLTGLSTHVRALSGNSFMTMIRAPEKIVGGAADALVYGMGLKKTRSIYAREGIAELKGIFNAFKSEQALAKRFGETKAINSSWESAWSMLVSKTKYFDEATKAQEVMHRTGAIQGTLGEIVRAPARAIGAVDVFFKEMNTGAELYAHATRLGLKEGRRGKDLALHVQNVIENPTKEMLEYAQKSARERVFQAELGTFGKLVNKARRDLPLTRLVLPFWNTPVNLLKQAYQRTPLSLARNWKKVYAEGGQEVVMEYIGRMITGSAMLTGVTMWAMNGDVSGRGPASKAQRNAKRQTGWSPYSVKIGDDWLSYRGFEPLSSFFLAGADIAEGYKDEQSMGKVGKDLTVSFVNQFFENPFFMGLNDVMGAKEELSKDQVPRVLSGMATGAVIPVILQQWATRVWDPVIREPKGFIEQFKSRVPFGVSKSVKPMRNIYGEEIKRDNPYAQAMGFMWSYAKGTKMDKEISRLGIAIGKPSKIVNGYEMTDDEYERFYVLKGTQLKQSLQQLIDSEGYQDLSDKFRVKVIRNTVANVNRWVKAQEFEKYYQDKKIDLEGLPD